tara:strand:+ start:148 stop:675 length:528 start_codon:yes stop_codon:yes gene_type:complete
MSELTLVTLDNAHKLIPEYIVSKGLMIGSYEDMMDVILSMIKDRHFFNMDKNILRGCLEDLTFMYSPGDDVNKDRVVAMLEPSDDEDSDEDDDSDGDNASMEQFQEMMMKQLSSQMGGMDLEKMMGAMSGGVNDGDGEVNKEQESEQVKEDEVEEVEEVNTEGSEELSKEEGGAE